MSSLGKAKCQNLGPSVSLKEDCAVILQSIWWDFSCVIPLWQAFCTPSCLIGHWGWFGRVKWIQNFLKSLMYVAFFLHTVFVRSLESCAVCWLFQIGQRWWNWELGPWEKELIIALLWWAGAVWRCSHREENWGKNWPFPCMGGKTSQQKITGLLPQSHRFSPVGHLKGYDPYSFLLFVCFGFCWTWHKKFSFKV
jgi:hypothetical protein